MLLVVTSSEVWDEEAAERYESDNPHLYASEVLNATLEFLERLVGSGPALEFAIGTGRVGGSAAPPATEQLDRVEKRRRWRRESLIRTRIVR